MIVTRKAISRRTVLRGIGTAVALPLLDAMVPALTALQKTPAKAGAPPRRRLPPQRRHLRELAAEGRRPRRSSSRRCSRRSSRSAISCSSSPGLPAIRPRRSATAAATTRARRARYLTGVHVKKSDSVVGNGISMDQIAAKAFERETQLSSLQLTADDNSLVGACDVGYSCAYSSTLSWLTPTLPLMAENNPRVVFERLFGSSDSTDPRVRASRLRQDRSILDSVTARVRQLQQTLGPADNTQGERLPRVAARRGAADPEGGGAEREGGAGREPAGGRSRRVRAARASCSTTCSCSPTSPT